MFALITGVRSVKIVVSRILGLGLRGWRIIHSVGRALVNSTVLYARTRTNQIISSYSANNAIGK